MGERRHGGAMGMILFVVSAAACADRDDGGVVQEKSAVLTGAPVGWSDAAVGSTMPPSAAVFAPTTGTLTMTGNGGGVRNNSESDTADEMRYVFRQVTGDVEVVARLVEVTGAAGADVGVTIRAAAGSADPMAAGFITLLGCSDCFPARDVLRVASATLSGRGQGDSRPTILPRPTDSNGRPIWLRLQRVGNDFSVARRLDDSLAWVPFTSVSGGAFPFPSGTPYTAGLFVSGGATATFDNIYVGPPRLAYKTGSIGTSFDRTSTGRIGDFMNAFAVSPDGSRVYRYGLSDSGNGLTISDGATGRPLPISPALPSGGVTEAALAATDANVYFVSAAPNGGYCVKKLAPDYAPISDNCPPKVDGGGPPGPLTKVAGIAAANGKLYVSQPVDTTPGASNPQDKVTVLDGSSLAVIDSFPVPARPGVIAATAGEIWVADMATDFPHRGNLDVKAPAPQLRAYRTTGGFTDRFNGRSISGLQNPSALAYHASSNRLYVAENGAEQRIKVYTLASTPPQASTPVGANGGIFAPGAGGVDQRGLVDVPGTPARFYNLMGVGVDNAGNLYVASTTNGADIRKVTATGDLVWQTYGVLDRYNVVDFDQTTDGAEAYSARHHFVFDPLAALPFPLGNKGDSEWRFKSVTWDFFPPAPGYTEVNEHYKTARRSAMTFVRQLGATKVLFASSVDVDDDRDGPGPHGGKSWLKIYRLKNEIAIPCGHVSIEHVCGSGDTCEVDRCNSGDLTPGVDVLEIWVDGNANGRVDAGETTRTPDPFDPANPDVPLQCTTRPLKEGCPATLPECPVPEDTDKRTPGTLPLQPLAFDVDRDLNIWIAFQDRDSWPVSTGTGMWQIKRAGQIGLPGDAIPNYLDPSVAGTLKAQRSYFPVPREVLDTGTGTTFPLDVRSLRYDARADVMYLMTVAPTAPASGLPQYWLAAYPHWSSIGSARLGMQHEETNVPYRFFRPLPDPRPASAPSLDITFPSDVICPACVGGKVEPSGDSFAYAGLALGEGGGVQAADKIFVSDYYGAMSAFEAGDGALAITLPPGPENSGYKSFLDGNDGIRAFRRLSGEYLVSSTDAGGHASNVAYHWTPGTCVSSIGCTAQDECRGYWKVEEGSGTQLVDASGRAVETTAVGASWIPGFEGRAISFPTGTEYAHAKHNGSTKITGPITMAAWVMPQESGREQYILKKARKDLEDGYELGLDATGKPFVRFNQVTSGDTYRLTAASDPARQVVARRRHLRRRQDPHLRERAAERRCQADGGSHRS